MKISSPWSLFIVSVVGVTFSLLIIFIDIDMTTSMPDIVLQTHMVSGLPVSLSIPKIHVSADLEHVGLTSLGAMAVPKGPIDAAWYDLGPRPGEEGSAVIAGHEGWKDGVPAVFDDLYKLTRGDKVYVKDNTGTTTVFVVNKVESFGENDDASSVFDSGDGLSHLNLITCEGIWDATTQSYSDRLVVFAEKYE